MLPGDIATTGVLYAHAVRRVGTNFGDSMPFPDACTMAGERILLVDDDESIRQVVSIFLSDEGYTVARRATVRRRWICSTSSGPT